MRIWRRLNKDQRFFLVLITGVAAIGLPLGYSADGVPALVGMLIFLGVAGPIGLIYAGK